MLTGSPEKTNYSEMRNPSLTFTALRFEALNYNFFLMKQKHWFHLNYLGVCGKRGSLMIHEPISQVALSLSFHSVVVVP